MIAVEKKVNLASFPGERCLFSFTAPLPEPALHETQKLVCLFGDFFFFEKLSNASFKDPGIRKVWQALKLLTFTNMSNIPLSSDIG